MMRIFTVNENIKKLAAWVLLVVVVYFVALELVPWPWPAVLAVPASIANVLAVVLIGAPVFLPGYLIIW